MMTDAVDFALHAVTTIRKAFRGKKCIGLSLKKKERFP
jgi:hypothetical protein